MADSQLAVLVRMPAVLKHDLQREAYVHRRTLTAEILMRLEATLKAEPTAAATSADPNSARAAQELELLQTFRKLPPAKRMALLDLLR